MFKTFRLQEHFKQFRTTHPDLIYLNSAATTLRPDQIAQTIMSGYHQFPFSINSIDNQLSALGFHRLEAIRNQTAHFFDALPEEVIFTPSTTFSLNQLANGLRNEFQPGDEIILSDLEHNANLAPWIALKTALKLKIKYLHFHFPCPDYLKQLKSLLTKRTRIIALSSVDNTISYHLPMAKIVQLVKQTNPLIKIIADVTQFIGKRPFSFARSQFDFACFSPHKMFGPYGLGIMLVKKDLQAILEPILKGSNSVVGLQPNRLEYNQQVAKFEGGTFDLPTLFGFEAALQFLGKFQLSKIEQHLNHLYQYLLKKLLAIPQIRVFHHNQLAGSSLIFDFKTLNSHDVATYLADVHQILLRSGNHCAFLTEKVFQTQQTLRVSFHFYNDFSDLDFLVTNLVAISQNPAIVLERFQRKLQSLLFNYGRISQFPFLVEAKTFSTVKNLTCADFVHFSFLKSSAKTYRFGFKAEACLITVATINLLFQQFARASIQNCKKLLQNYLAFFTHQAKPHPDLQFLTAFGQLFYQKHRINCATFWAQHLWQWMENHVHQ